MEDNESKQQTYVARLNKIIGALNEIYVECLNIKAIITGCPVGDLPLCEEKSINGLTSFIDSLVEDINKEVNGLANFLGVDENTIDMFEPKPFINEVEVEDER